MGYLYRRDDPDDFRDASGIEVSMDLFADNDELFAKLKEGNPGYDVIVPTNDFVERMIRANMLIKLDHSKIPNFKNVDKVFRDAAFDPIRAHSMPYMWGTIGIGYRKSKVSKVPDSWSTLSNPANIQEGSLCSTAHLRQFLLP